MRSTKRVFIVLAAVATLAAAQPAAASPIILNLFPFTGAPSQVRVTIDDMVNAGFITFTVDVVSPLGDLQGLFFDVDYAGPLAAGDFSGSDLTGVGFNTANMGGGNNVNPMGPFDVGLRIGTPGIGSDDIGSTTLLMADHGAIQGSDIGTVAARMTSVGPAGARNGSSKLIADTPEFPPVPEPATLALLGVGLVGMGVGGLRRRRRA